MDGLGTAPTDQAAVMPVVDTDWLDNLQADQTAAVETPLPPEGSVKADAPEDQQPAETVEEQTAGEPKPEVVEPETPAAPVTDPELSEADNALVQAAPEAQREEIATKLKRSSFVNEYRNPDRPMTEVLTEMERLSPSRAEAMKQTVVSQALSDPAAFAKNLFEADPQKYGEVATAIEDGHPDFWVKRHTGVADATLDEVRQAIPFFRANKDRIAELGSNVPSLSEEELASITEFHPDLAPKVQQILDALKTTPATPNGLTSEERAELERLRAETTTKQETTKADTAATEQANLESRYQQAEGEVYSYLNAKLDDTEKGYGLKVTDEERRLSPDVANLRDTKRDILMRGAGDLPTFNKGFEEYGKNNEEILKIAGRIAYFVEHNEIANAQEEARKMRPHADAYMTIRATHPRVKWIDSQIQAALARNGQKPPVETFVPGGHTAPSGKAQADMSNDEWIDSL